MMMMLQALQGKGGVELDVRAALVLKKDEWLHVDVDATAEVVSGGGGGGGCAYSWDLSGVAVLGKDNNPLYIRAYDQHDQLRFHFIVHTALDFLEEKRARPAANPPPPRCVRARS